MQITLYTKNNCPQCQLTKRFLVEHCVHFTEINLEEHPEEVQLLSKEGFKRAPIVKTDTNISFSGFQLDKLKTLI